MDYLSALMFEHIYAPTKYTKAAIESWKIKYPPHSQIEYYITGQSDAMFYLHPKTSTVIS